MQLRRQKPEKSLALSWDLMDGRAVGIALGVVASGLGLLSSVLWSHGKRVRARCACVRQKRPPHSDAG
jgi:hypothetical protein